MNEATKQTELAPKWLRITGRIWSAPIIIFALFMAAGYTWSWLTTGVADPYAVEGTTWVEALPPVLLFFGVLGLILAWRWERLGGGISLLFTAAVVITLIIQGPAISDLSRSLIPYLLCLVILIPGILFLIYGLRSGSYRQI